MILGIGDLHFSEYSSIDRRRGTGKYSKREESLINTLNWVEETAENNEVDKIVFFGDFFDKTELNASELTALQEVQWSNIPHIFIVGNHEGLTSNLVVSSAHLLNLIPNARVIDSPTIEYNGNSCILYLPYIIEQERLPLQDYFHQAGLEPSTEKYKVVFSHNDIKMKYGIYESVIGFEPANIDEQSDLFLNGHIHNCGKISKVGYNLGNITGQNFSENAMLYGHYAYLINTDNLELQQLENPFALNFYKAELQALNDVKAFINNLKTNAIVSLKVPQQHVQSVKELLKGSTKIKESRVISIIETDSAALESDSTTLESVNHLDEFIKFVTNSFELTDLVKEELSEVCR